MKESAHARFVADNVQALSCGAEETSHSERKVEEEREEEEKEKGNEKGSFGRKGKSPATQSISPSRLFRSICRSK